MIEAHIFRLTGKMDEIEFLLLKRSEVDIYPGVWQMVTGAMQKNERANHTALREIHEETGLVPQKMWVVPYVNSFYSIKRDHICLVPVFAACVSGDEDIILSDEHTEYKWVDKDTAVKLLAWPGQRNSVDVIYNYFTHERSFLNFEEINFQKNFPHNLKGKKKS
jgi:dATP pyrophosphohydrolase